MVDSVSLFRFNRYCILRSNRQRIAIDSINEGNDETPHFPHTGLTSEF